MEPTNTDPIAPHASSPSDSGEVRDIDVTVLAKCRDTTRVIDVREPSEFTGSLGHIAGAELVPLAQLRAEAIDWDRAAQLAVVCRTGNRSRHAALQLQGLGFQRVVNVAGGMTAWRAAGLPVERTP